MALFTSKADADLPLSTTFYQLEIATLETFQGSEMDHWITARLSKRYKKQFDLFSSMLLRITNNNSAFIPNLETYINSHIRFHSLLRNVMDAFADGKYINDNDNKELNDFIRLDIPAASIVLNEENKKYEIKWVSDAPLESAIPIILMEVIGALGRENNEGIKLFGRCAECKNAFLGAKPGQRFCSSRCSHREGERRRYALRYDLTLELQNIKSEKKGGKAS